jgi:hypothetical protein
LRQGFHRRGHATEGSCLREGRRGRFTSPDTGQHEGEPRGLARVAFGRGPAARLPLFGSFRHVLHPPQRAACAEGRSPFNLPSRLFSLNAAAQSQLDPVIVTGTRAPQPLGSSSADAWTTTLQLAHDLDDERAAPRLRSGASRSARRPAPLSPQRSCSRSWVGAGRARPRWPPGEASTSLLLVGVMIGSGCSALVSLILTLADEG